MSASPATRSLSCWCGNRDLSPYSPEYRACRACGTLVSAVGLTAAEIAVQDDEQDFYGKSYWLEQQTHGLGLPDITQRARADVPERCLYWLRTVLRHKPPPARVLEVGCAHGGFVALLRSLGYDAIGLELSPWLVDFARRTFGVPMLLGLLEEQNLPAQSFDAVVLNDVLEHLADPATTIACCARLLTDGGALVIQTPCYPEGASHAELVGRQDPFLKMIDNLGRQHLYLFSRRSVRHFLEGLGVVGVEFLPALYPYDMYLVAGRGGAPLPDEAATVASLLGEPAGRLAVAWLDLLREREQHQQQWLAAMQAQSQLEWHIHQMQSLLRQQDEALVAANYKLRTRTTIGVASAAGRRLRRLFERWRSSNTEMTRGRRDTSHPTLPEHKIG